MLTATGAGAGQRYVNASLGFALTPPAGWVQTARPDVVVAFEEPDHSLPAVQQRPSRQESNREFLERIGRKLAAYRNRPAGYRASMFVLSVQKPGLTLAAYVRQARSRANKVAGCSVLGESDRRLGGLYAVEQTTRTKFPDRPPLRTRQVICRRGDRIVVIGLAAPNAQYERYSHEFDKTLASFVWR